MNLELGRTGRERELSASWTRADRERLDRRIELFQNGMRLKSRAVLAGSTRTNFYRVRGRRIGNADVICRERAGANRERELRLKLSRIRNA
ncbi:hypothetical protein F2Q68_00004370 [Brassica cretica]|uniref:Uncharacterized protein n=1 Tax=Brassica cretica TaxID=69181 RepID=A0A8S9J9F9_BRACR|nr:hypothetical protein F2Q68_00004370 [Brassica cretica]